jgi:hypothetical protein
VKLSVTRELVRVGRALPTLAAHAGRPTLTLRKELRGSAGPFRENNEQAADVRIDFAPGSVGSFRVSGTVGGFEWRRLYQRPGRGPVHMSFTIDTDQSEGSGFSETSVQYEL